MSQNSQTEGCSWRTRQARTNYVPNITSHKDERFCTERCAILSLWNVNTSSQRRLELSFFWNHSYCGLVLFPGGSVVLNNGATTTSDSSDWRQQWYKYSLVGTVYHVPWTEYKLRETWEIRREFWLLNIKEEDIWQTNV